MNHPVLDASPSIEAILGGRFIRSCQPETILLLGLGTTEPQLNQPILWGVRGAESKISNPPKLGRKVRKQCISMHAFFFFFGAPSQFTNEPAKKCAKNAPKIHIFAYSVTLFSAAPSQFTNEPPPRFLGLLPCFPLRVFLE